MTATYNYSGDPTTSDLDNVRFLLRDTGPVPPNEDDTVSTGWELSDQEIAYLLTEDDNVFMAAALGALQIATGYGIKANKRIGPLNINYKGQLETYTNLATALQKKANTYAKQSGAVMTQSSNDHIFTIGMDDDPNDSLIDATQSPWYGSQS